MDEVHRAQGQAPGFHVRAVEGGDEDHRQFPGGRIGLDLAAEGKTVQVGHDDVEQENVGPAALLQVELDVGAVGEGAHLVVFLEHGLQQQEVFRLVVGDDEDGPGGHGAFSCNWSRYWWMVANSRSSWSASSPARTVLSGSPAAAAYSRRRARVAVGTAARLAAEP